MAGAPIFSIAQIASYTFTSRVEASDVKAYTVYNHMLLPSALYHFGR